LPSTVNRQPSTVYRQPSKMSHSLKIGITDCGKYENYHRWIEAEYGMEPVKLSMQFQNATDVEICDGILFSGGEDLQPVLYGKPEYVEAFGLQEIIPERDRFEYEVLEKAFASGKPVLGICRGLQLINVFLGGTLVPDIPAIFHFVGHGKKNGLDRTHQIQVEPGSLLHQICGQEQGIVNSAHHQSAEQPADALKITAVSEPGIVEAMEWRDPSEKPWLLMLQWHPERMSDLSSPFSAFVKNAFLDAAKKGKLP
jgi:putative glutamine amidotransferase